MTQPLVRYEVADLVARITLDDHATRNALGDVLLDHLLGRLEQARDDDGVRVVVLTSANDKVFSSGGDLRAFAGAAPVLEKYAGLDRFPRLFRLLGSLRKPSVCVANGDVLAGAFGLALACDLVVAREGVRFGCPEINVGVFPFMISALIYRSVPRVVANELMMTGELISAERAHELHLVNRVVPADELDATVAADPAAGLPVAAAHAARQGRARRDPRPAAGRGSRPPAGPAGARPYQRGRRRGRRGVPGAAGAGLEAALSRESSRAAPAGPDLPTVWLLWRPPGRKIGAAPPAVTGRPPASGRESSPTMVRLEDGAGC